MYMMQQLNTAQKESPISSSLHFAAIEAKSV